MANLRAEANWSHALRHMFRHDYIGVFAPAIVVAIAVCKHAPIDWQGVTPQPGARGCSVALHT